jgi:RimJ/RimL family protein N-acetyltransferase
MTSARPSHPVPPERLDAPGFFLRAWSPADAPLLRAALEESDAHLRAWTPWVVDGREPGVPLDARLARHVDDWATGRSWVWGIFAADASAVLGGCGLYARVGAGTLEAGYWLAARATGRGIATAAARLITDVALTLPGVQRVEMRIEPGNARSIAVPRRLGFVHEATIDVDGDALEVWATDRERWASSSR